MIDRQERISTAAAGEVAMVSHADVVVIGSGGFGASTAYHLARRGVGRVALLDRHALGSQTSPRAAGLTSKVASTELMVQLVHEAVETLSALAETTGHGVGFMRVGAMRAVLTAGGEAQVRANAEIARRLGVPVQWLSAAAAEARAPFFRAGEARAVMLSPEDGYFHPPLVARAFAAAAADRGAVLLPHTPVVAILRDGGRVTGVRTSWGDIAAGAVVDAAGAWTGPLAAAVGIRVPMIPTRHQLFITETLDGVEAHHPIVRIHEPSVYVRPEAGGLLVGGYEDQPLQVDMAEQAAEFQVADVALDLEVLRGLVDEVAPHFPALKGAPIREHRGGLPTMSPDGRHIVGPVPGLAGLFIASACNVGGLSISASVGRALADLIVDGACVPDLEPFSLARFAGRFGDAPSLRDACQDAYARKYTK